MSVSPAPHVPVLLRAVIETAVGVVRVDASQRLKVVELHLRSYRLRAVHPQEGG